MEPAGRPSPDEGVRRTKIVATVGPASRDEHVLTALLEAGIDLVRLNFSHGTREEHGRSIALVREIAQRLGRTVAIIQDLQGPRIRTGALVGARLLPLSEGTEVVIDSASDVSTPGRIAVSYPRLAADVRPGQRILLDDGRMELRALASEGNTVRAQVVRGGLLGERRGVNLPGLPLRLPVLTEKDEEDLAFGLALGVDYVALSFVRSGEDIRWAREVMERHGAPVPIIAKLERPEAVEHLEEVMAASDAVMVARGDLGVELTVEDVPLLQKKIIRRANEMGRPVITATQMLESMLTSPEPTRAEASDVANAVLDGSDALMLSGETAVGAHPLAAVAVMERIARAAEGELGPARPWESEDPIHAVAHAAYALAEHLAVRAIAVFTRTGRTARLLSQARPPAPIYAFTPDERIGRQLALWWGVTSIQSEFKEHTEAMIAHVVSVLLARGLVRVGDLVVMVGASPLRVGMHTNFVQLQVVGSLRGAGGAAGRG